MFWIIAAGLTCLTCLALLTSFSRGGVVPDNHDRVFYQAQLNEIERQQSLHLIGPAEAEAARTEAARRLLSSAPASSYQPAKASARNLIAVITIIVIPAFALPIYIWIGAPSMPAFPLAERLASASSTQDKRSSGQQPGFNVENALQQIETHLAKNPGDGRGHEVVAPIYLRMARYDDAVRAFEASLRILGGSAERYVNLGEALVFQAKGVVTAAARKTFEAALALDGNQIQAQFFLALSAQQDGDILKARAMLTSIHGRIPDGDLKVEITQQLAALDAIPKGGEGVASLPQGQQQEAIRGMVENLAQRLTISGGTPEEWARLVRALRVLGENDRVTAILTEARLKFADRPDQLRLIDDAGRIEK